VERGGGEGAALLRGSPPNVKVDKMVAPASRRRRRRSRKIVHTHIIYYILLLNRYKRRKKKNTQTSGEMAPTRLAFPHRHSLPFFFFKIKTEMSYFYSFFLNKNKNGADAISFSAGVYSATLFDNNRTITLRGY
jgi:hypothetical protein